MKKLFALPLAAFVFAACSEPTASDAVRSDLTPVFGKSDPAPDPEPTCAAPGGPSGPCATWTGETGIAAAGDFGISSTDTEVSPSGQRFAGRWAGADPVAITFPDALGTVNVLFDLYIIGTWEGEAKKVPPHIFEMSSRCTTTGARTRIIFASISNKRGGYQSYPEDIGTKGGHFGGYGMHDDINALGYTGETDQPDGTNQFTGDGDVASAVYTVSKSIANTCSDPADFQLVLEAHNIGPSVWDASWGIDNFSMTTSTGSPPPPCVEKGNSGKCR